MPSVLRFDRGPSSCAFSTVTTSLPHTVAVPSIINYSLSQRAWARWSEPRHTQPEQVPRAGASRSHPWKLPWSDATGNLGAQHSMDTVHFRGHGHLGQHVSCR